jgi:predicted permease
LGLIFYFCDLQLILPIENTVSKIAETVPTISSLLVGMFLSAFPLKGFKLQFDAIILTVFRLFLLPLIVSALCMIIKISLENTLILVVLSGLPCGFDLPCEISQIQEKNLPCASTLSALSFVASLISIPLICYVTSQIYLFIF